jgi:predicted nucleic acid-binding protein
MVEERLKTEVVPLDGSHAQALGALLARNGTSDVADAHLVICVQRAGYAVITSDPRDLKRLDTMLLVIVV